MTSLSRTRLMCHVYLSTDASICLLSISSICTLQGLPVVGRHSPPIIGYPFRRRAWHPVARCRWRAMAQEELLADARGMPLVSRLELFTCPASCPAPRPRQRGGAQTV